MRARTARRRAAISLALVTVLAVSGCAADPSVEIDAPAQVDSALPDDTQTQLEESVTHAMAAAGASGAIVGVWVPWSGTWVTGLGTESSTDETPVDADMVFRVADATRPMTCDVLYGVAAAGTVSLDDPVGTYVSGAPDLDDITLLDLCNGTSGLGSSQSKLQRLWLENPTRIWSPRELASFGIGADGGTHGSYRDSDAGYLLLGIALQNATGKSAARLISEYVADPLDLTTLSLPPASAPAPSLSLPVLKGHHSRKNAEGAMNCTEPLDVTDLSSSVGFTDAGVTSSIADLGRYGQALAAGALAAEGQPDRWAAPVPTGSRNPSWLQATGGAFLAGSLIGQHGAIPGYTTAVYSDPGTGMTVAVVLNNSGAGAKLGSYLAWELAAIASKAPPASGESAPEFGLPWTAEQYREAIAEAAICPLP